MIKELELIQITKDGNANSYPFCDMCHLDMSDIIFKKLGPLNNSLLHLAASFGNEELTLFMADQFPTLIIQTNSHGDTPLHVAARARMLRTAEILVDHAKIYHNLHPDEPHPLTMKNNEGNTVLHEALLALQLAPKSKHSKNPAKKGDGDISSLASSLAEHTGPEHVCNCQNKANQSPLCLAVEYGDLHLIEHFLKVTPVTTVHVDCSATAKCLVQLMTEDKLNLEVLELIHKEKPKLLDARDEAGNTLLHSAASTGHLKEVRYLSEIMSDNVLYENEQGSYAIHVASEKGYVKIVEALLKQWPYPTEILNAEGRSILHIAAKSGNEHLVRHILKSNKSDSDMLINMKDHDGNTPLHLAARHGHCLVLGTLLLDKRTNTALKNKTGHTAYDIALNVVKQSDEKQDGKNNKEDKHVDAKIDGVENITGLPRHGVTKNEKSSAKVDHSTPNPFGMLTTLSVFFLGHLFAMIRRCKINSGLRTIKDLRYRVKSKKATENEDVNQKINAFLVVATLVVGVAFAASVQVGSSDIGDDKGGDDSKNNNTTYLFNLTETTIKKVEKSALQLFAVSDTFAMNAAVIGATLLCWAQLIHTNLASLLVLAAYAFVAISIAMLEIAYSCSILFKLHSYTLGAFIPIIFLHYTCFCIQFSVSMAVLISPLRETLVMLFYFFIFCGYYALYRFCTFFVPPISH